MVSIPRQGQFGFPVHLPQSSYTQERVMPTKGYTDLPDIPAGPQSIVSGQNIWIWQERLTPRPRLQQLGTNALSDVPTGAFTYYDVTGDGFPMIFSKGTATYFDPAAGWTTLSYNSNLSSGVNHPPSGGQNDRIFGTATYLPRADTNIAVWVNGVDPAFCWGGPINTGIAGSEGTGYSTLTQAYIAHDVTIANSRLVYWNVGYTSTSSQLVTRVAWTAAGDPEDNTGIDAGYQDLLDMRGVGTRCFTVADQLVVATDQEIWRGTFVGPPYVYQFTPLSRTQGVPFPRAAINTPEGLFFLGDDDMVYNIPPFYWYSKIDPVGIAVQRTLHNQMADATTAFFGYHADAKQLTLYYTDTTGAYPNRGLTYNTLSKVWTPQKFAQNLVVGFTGDQTSANTMGTSSATTWGALVGPLSGNILTYNQLLGFSGGGTGGIQGLEEACISSAGTAYTFQHGSVQSTDDGVQVMAEATLGPMFVALPDRRKFFDEVRVDVQADSSSVLSIAISGDLGQTFPVETALQLSQGSTSSQYRVKSTGVSGINHTIRIRSQDGTWNIPAITGKAKIEGEAI